MTDAEKALSKAKTRLMLGAGKFIASVAVQLNHKIDNSVPTAATNGKEVLYNEEFLMALTPEERIGLIAHESWHVAFLHIARRQERDPVVWNYAGDFVINGEIKKDSILLPEPHLFDQKYEGMSTEAVYDLLIEDPPEMPEGLVMDIIGEDEAMTEAEGKQLEQDIQEILVKAVTQARMENDAGSIPREIARVVDELINPRLDWKQLLERFVSTSTKDDYSWKRPNRRFFPQMHLPAAYSEQVDHIMVAIDTSGSVNEEMMTEMLAEIKNIFELFAPRLMTIMDCDYEIHNIHEVDDGEEILSLTFSGWGGTSFLPVLEYAKQHNPTVVLYFTDLYAEHIPEDCEYDFPLMWICYSDHEPQGYGETIYYESKRS